MINITAIKNKIWTTDALLLLIATIILLSYLILDMPIGTVHIVKIGLDNQIPRLPIFTIPYLAFLPWLYITLIYAWYKNRFFRQLAYSFIVINLIAFIVYATYQTIVPRDPIVSNDLFSNILGFIYNNNLPYAGFPSLHCGLSASIATYYVCMKSKWSWAAVTMAMLVIASTLFTKQHFILDAISGVMLGIFVTWIVFRFVPKQIM